MVICDTDAMTDMSRPSFARGSITAVRFAEVAIHSMGASLGDSLFRDDGDYENDEVDVSSPNEHPRSDEESPSYLSDTSSAGACEKTAADSDSGGLESASATTKMHL